MNNNHIQGLDGFRAIAVSIVFIAHYMGNLAPEATTLIRFFPAMLGVSLFFVVSGFLITTLLLREHEVKKSISIRNFYIRRLLRLTPALYVYVAVCFLAYLWADGAVRVWDFVAALTYTSNYYQIAAKTALYYMPVWSLAIEEHFYIVFPALLALTLRRSYQNLTIAIIAAIVVCTLWRLTQIQDPNVDWHHIYWRTDTRLDSILYGCLLACICHFKEFQKYKDFIIERKALLIALILMAISVVYRDEQFRMSWRYTLQGISLSLIVGHVVYSQDKYMAKLRQIFELGPVLYLSKISYSLYLWHLTIIMFALHVNADLSKLGMVLCAVGSIAISALSYEYIEKPFLRLRKRFGSHAGE